MTAIDPGLALAKVTFGMEDKLAVDTDRDRPPATDSETVEPNFVAIFSETAAPAEDAAFLPKAAPILLPIPAIPREMADVKPLKLNSKLRGAAAVCWKAMEHKRRKKRKEKRINGTGCWRWTKIRMSL